jgi:hypothetical protein
MLLVVPAALAAVVSRNFVDGLKVIMFIFSFALLVSLEISVAGTLFWSWFSDQRFHIN